MNDAECVRVSGSAAEWQGWRERTDALFNVNLYACRSLCLSVCLSILSAPLFICVFDFFCQSVYFTYLYIYIYIFIPPIHAPGFRVTEKLQ